MTVKGIRVIATMLVIVTVAVFSGTLVACKRADTYGTHSFPIGKSSPSVSYFRLRLRRLCFTAAQTMSTTIVKAL